MYEISKGAAELRVAAITLLGTFLLFAAEEKVECLLLSPYPVIWCHSLSRMMPNKLLPLLTTPQSPEIAILVSNTLGRKPNKLFLVVDERVHESWGLFCGCFLFSL